MAKVRINGVDIEFEGQVVVNGQVIEDTGSQVLEAGDRLYGTDNGKTYVVIRNRLGELALMNEATFTVCGKCYKTVRLSEGETMDDICNDPSTLEFLG